VQALSQQTPSTQKPVGHCEAIVQVAALPALSVMVVSTAPEASVTGLEMPLAMICDASPLSASTANVSMPAWMPGT
jgi:hypothetical protein